ncbi:hypothetical protein MHJ95_10150 [Corynebacterium imitans]|uniref:hypothetical protein n=1 Tax=Corynebacterium imitans TaxID=156978 RepID=UPI001EF214C3|nr:hypothetical protein [Corynebacterium imitans]MCG7279338.1 hypothetical protein [Corynebacterium imitans]
MTTLHRISVPADAEALVFPDPYRSNVELTESMSTGPFLDFRLGFLIWQQITDEGCL